MKNTINELLKSDRRMGLRTLTHPLNSYKTKVVRDELDVYIPQDFAERENIHAAIEEAVLSRDPRIAQFMTVFCEQSGLSYEKAAEVLLSNDDPYGFDRRCSDCSDCEAPDEETGSCDTCILRYLFVYSWYLMAEALGLANEYQGPIGSHHFYYTVVGMMKA